MRFSRRHYVWRSLRTKTMEETSSRKEQIGRLSRILRKYSQPRFQLFLILLLTASAGAGASFVLLKVGLAAMWLRYSLAALIGYLTFLGLLQLWVQFQLSDPLVAMKVSETKPEGEAKSMWSAWDVNPFDLLDIGSMFDDLPIVILVFAVLVVLIVVIGIIVAAPVLLAEVLLDGLLVAGLWHRFKRYGAGESLRSAVRATILPAIFVVVCLGAIGLALQQLAPGADSIGDVFRLQR
jgi:hypothetical protein